VARFKFHSGDLIWGEDGDDLLYRGYGNDLLVGALRRQKRSARRNAKVAQGDAVGRSERHGDVTGSSEEQSRLFAFQALNSLRDRAQVDAPELDGHGTEQLVLGPVALPCALSGTLPHHLVRHVLV
jgi:hypothetical protein